MQQQMKIHKFVLAWIIITLVKCVKTNDVLSEFAAKYLPALMTAYRECSGPVNAPMTMLNTISYTFVFFFRRVLYCDRYRAFAIQILLCSISAYACGE